eukprot:SAG31_NODE_389_length_16370_cov_4.517915_8_plen_41_part_00
MAHGTWLELPKIAVYTGRKTVIYRICKVGGLNLASQVLDA